jgi:hypothetical protein
MFYRNPMGKELQLHPEAAQELEAFLKEVDMKHEPVPWLVHYTWNSNCLTLKEFQPTGIQLFRYMKRRLTMVTLIQKPIPLKQRDKAGKPVQVPGNLLP